MSQFDCGPPMTPDVEELLSRVALRLDPCTAIVTGAGSTGDEHPGVGEAIATVLAAAGAHVVVLDRDHAAAEHTVATLAARGLSALAVRADVTSRADCDAAAAKVVDIFGRLDILVNNAAVLGEAPTLDASDEDFLMTLDVNLVGPVRMARACLPHLGRGSTIVNISSLGALRTFGKIDYEASKGGMLSLTNTLAVQLGRRGVRVNAVMPGQVWTPMGKRRLVGLGQDDGAIAATRRSRAVGCPIGEEGTGWDIGLAVLFLVSVESRWITGHTLVVDGGQSGVVGYMPGS
jgi:NAD(P)-dependent dehydrogenase (short-subunit alcohol dehydrogenase family)